MANVTNYHVLFYGSPSGYQNLRAQITLFDANKVLAYVRFKDEGMVAEEDYSSDGIIRMFLPVNMYGNTIDLLRNEKPIQVDFRAGKGLLSTSSKEMVGEGE